MSISWWMSIGGDGAITNIAPTPTPLFPRQGTTYFLRLQDGRHGQIFIDSINRGDRVFVAEFTGKGPLLSPAQPGD